MSNKYSGYDAVLAVDIAATMTDIVAVRDISGPSMAADTIEVTARDDGHEHKEFIAGLRDGGEVTFDCVYDPEEVTHSATEAGGMVTLLAAGTSSSYELTFSDGTSKATFEGIVTGFEPKTPLNDAQTADVTIKVSGVITWA